MLTNQTVRSHSGSVLTLRAALSPLYREPVGVCMAAVEPVVRQFPLSSWPAARGLSADPPDATSLARRYRQHPVVHFSSTISRIRKSFLCLLAQCRNATGARCTAATPAFGDLQGFVGRLMSPTQRERVLCATQPWPQFRVLASVPIYSGQSSTHRCSERRTPDWPILSLPRSAYAHSRMPIPLAVCPYLIFSRSEVGWCTDWTENSRNRKHHNRVCV